MRCICRCPLPMVLQTYHYNVDMGPCHDPLRVRYSHHAKRPLDLEAVRAAAQLLTGTHNFTQFSNDSQERLRRNPVKTLTRFDVVEVAPDHVRLEVGWWVGGGDGGDGGVGGWFICGGS